MHVSDDSVKPLCSNDGGGPHDLWQWTGPPPTSWQRSTDGNVTIEAAEHSDLFHMPGIREVDHLGALACQLDGDFTVTVNVSVAGDVFADAAGLIVRSPGASLKACIERRRSPDWAVVTVLTTEASDECYGAVAPQGAGGLLVTRQGHRIAVFWRPLAADDWEFVRTFWWPAKGPAAVGLFAQAPFSTGHRATFRGLRVEPSAMRDRR